MSTRVFKGGLISEYDERCIRISRLRGRRTATSARRLRAAWRNAFDEALFVLEKNAVVAAKVLVDQLASLDFHSTSFT
jgi:hypothetical protein